MKKVRKLIRVSGLVQGVGFRPFVTQLARELLIQGQVKNNSFGVEIEIEGAPSQLNQFCNRLKNELPSPGRIDSWQSEDKEFLGYTNFSISVDLDDQSTVMVTIMPDLATCKLCLEELFHPQNRRYLYPFLNCTHCGPRYSIVESLPYDRSRTTMKNFIMCDECLNEYNNPLNRRFHAEPNACPKCGPQLSFSSSNITGHEALKKSCDLLQEGQILALKGIGGYQLLVDALNPEAIKRLREKKQRGLKPFAIMAPHQNWVFEHCIVSSLEKELLLSPEAPIVLLRKKIDLPEVAPQNPYLGVMLPYSPLHHLIMKEVNTPVVATSGNLSEEPICTHEAEATERLKNIADGFLNHNRPIFRPIDDSVIKMISSKPVIFRRARGYAPLPLIGDTFKKSMVALGGQMKNTIAITKGADIVLSQHIGDLDNQLSFDRFKFEYHHLLELYRLKPEVMIIDKHPQFSYTTFASHSFPYTSIKKMQHHKAHLFSCLADSGQKPPGLGVIWDGTGLGDDNTIWGGEFFLINEKFQIEHFATFYPFLLVGGNKSIKKPQTLAQALLYEIYGASFFESSKLFEGNQNEISNLKIIFEKKINSTPCHSVGRLFDGVAVLLGFNKSVEFEAEAALWLEFLAEKEIPKLMRESLLSQYHQNSFINSKNFLINSHSSHPMIIDWRPFLKFVIETKEYGAPSNHLAFLFHKWLADVTLKISQLSQMKNIFLSGGCFQNTLLTEMVILNLTENNFIPIMHKNIPPNDGGLAAGQIFGLQKQMDF